MVLIFVALIALIVWAATYNRQATFQNGPVYYEPGVVIVEEPPIVDAMIAADIASGIAFGAAEGAMMHDQGGFFDSGGDSGFGGGDSGFGGGSDFLGGDSGFDSSGGGFDSGGGGDF